MVRRWVVEDTSRARVGGSRREARRGAAGARGARRGALSAVRTRTLIVIAALLAAALNVAARRGQRVATERQHDATKALRAWSAAEGRRGV